MRKHFRQRDFAGLAAHLGISPSQLGRAVNRAAAVPDTSRVVMPDNAADLANWLTSAESAPFKSSPAAMAALMVRYAEQAQPAGGEVDKQIVDQSGEAIKLIPGPTDDADRQEVMAATQAAFLEMIRAQQGGTDTLASRLNLAHRSPRTEAENRRRGAAYNPHASGAKLDADFPDAIDFLRAIDNRAKSTGHPSYDARTKLEKFKNDYSSTIPADGGFLIPEQFRSELMQVALEEAIVRPRARTIPMSSLRLVLPFLDATSNVASVFGGMVAYWTEEGAALVESQAKFGRVQLEAHKLTGRSDVPNELLADAPAFRAFLENVWPRAISWYEDIAFIRGSGVGEPLGFLGAANPSSIGIAAEGGQAAASIVLENIVKMYARMLPSSLNSAVWLVSPNVLPELFTMALTVGTGGSAVYLTNATGAAPMTILGRPVIVTEKMNTVGTRGDIAFVDLNYYLIGDRQVMQMAASEHFQFGSDITTFRIISRVDGRPWLQNALTPQNGSTDTLSPFVELATRP